MDFGRENFGKDDMPQNIDNGLIIFNKSNDMAGSIENSNFKISEFAAKKFELPEKFDLLNSVGVNFAKYRYHIKKFILPYSVSLSGKFERLINLGYPKFSIDQFKKDHISIQTKAVKPYEKVRFFSSRVGDYGTVPWKYKYDTDYILINIDYPYKAETFVLANLERYSFKSAEYNSKGNIIINKGFSSAEYNKEAKLIKNKNLGLYKGLINLLAQDVIKSVTKKDAVYIINREYDSYYIFEYMKIAKFIREFVNFKDDGNYKLRKDVLLYDLFVNKDLTETEKIINEKCACSAFGLMAEMLDRLDNAKDLNSFKNQYENLLKLFKWMKIKANSKE